MENELFMCEGARVLLTQNLWVEAGLMNGALGYVRGYMYMHVRAFRRSYRGNLVWLRPAHRPLPPAPADA